MSESKRSGYSIRTDILGMAIGICQERVQREFENEHMKEEVDREPVNAFVAEDVIAVAQKLYAFVERGNDHGLDLGNIS